MYITIYIYIGRERGMWTGKLLGPNGAGPDARSGQTGDCWRLPGETREQGRQREAVGGDGRQQRLLHVPECSFLEGFGQKCCTGPA